MKANSIEEFFGTLLQSVTEAHKKHLMTGKYSSHKALNEFYDEMPELVDALIEHWQGTNGKVEKYENSLLATDMDTVEYLEELLDMCEEAKETLFDDQEALCSDIDDIIGQISSTLYQLRELREHRMISLQDYIKESLLEAQMPDPKDMTPVPEAYADTLLGVFWNRIRTVSEKRTMGWTGTEDEKIIKKYCQENRGVPVLTKFGTGKKLPCGDMVKFISCILANIKIQDAKDENYMQREVNAILKEIGIKDISVTIGAVDEIIDTYLDHINSVGVQFYNNASTRPFDGISVQWRTGHIDIKM